MSPRLTRVKFISLEGGAYVPIAFNVVEEFLPDDAPSALAIIDAKNPERGEPQKTPIAALGKLLALGHEEKREDGNEA